MQIALLLSALALALAGSEAAAPYRRQESMIVSTISTTAQTSSTTPTEITSADTLDEDDGIDFSLESFTNVKAKRIVPRYAPSVDSDYNSGDDSDYDSNYDSGYETELTDMDDEDFYDTSKNVKDTTSSSGSNTTPSSETDNAKLSDIEDSSTKGACTKKKGSLTNTAATSEKTMKGNSHTKETNPTISFQSVAPSQTSSTAFFKIKGNLPTYNNTVDLSTPCSVLRATDNSTFVDRAEKMNYFEAVIEFMNGWLEANRTTEGGIGIADFFYRSWGGTNNPMCGNLSSEYCTPSADCDVGKTAQDTTNPAIRKELEANLLAPRQAAIDTIDAYNAARTTVDGNIEYFVMTFVKFQKEKKDSSGILGIITAVVGAVLAIVTFGASAIASIAFDVATLAATYAARIATAETQLKKISEIGLSVLWKAEKVKAWKGNLLALQTAVLAYGSFGTMELSSIQSSLATESSSNLENSPDTSDALVAILQHSTTQMVDAAVAAKTSSNKEMYDEPPTEESVTFWNATLLSGIGDSNVAVSSSMQGNMAQVMDVQIIQEILVYSRVKQVSSKQETGKMVAQYPMILWTNEKAVGKKCGEDLEKTLGKTTDTGRPSMGWFLSDEDAKAVEVCGPDGSDRLMYLVNLNYDKGGSKSDHLATTLQGVTHNTLPNNDTNQFDSITVEKLVESGVGGFMANNNHNNFTVFPKKAVADDWNGIQEFNTSYEKGAATAGLFQVPVCLDLKEVLQNLKDGKYPPCAESPSINAETYEVPASSNGGVYGWEHGHFSVVKGEGKEGAENPTKGIPMIRGNFRDANNNELLWFPLQPGPVTITAETLKFGNNFTVAASDERIQFWYGDQYWESKFSPGDDDAHHTSIGKFDNDKSEGDTGWTASANPDTDDPSTPVPSDAKEAWLGNPNAGLTDETIPPFKIPDTVTTYKGGKCKVVIYQYQQNLDGDKNFANPGAYSMSMAVYDAAGTLIAFAPQSRGKVGVQGPLQWIVFAEMLESKDSSGVTVSYGEQKYTLEGEFKNDHRVLKLDDFAC